jgi:bifunctional DNA-binding transcriptional regulator/antitoxin component of YhaV-PrlF toxin-antitoxin module
VGEAKVLGTTKVRQKGIITLVKEAADVLDAKDGDHLAYYWNEENPDVVIIAKVRIQTIVEPIHLKDR